MNNSNLNAHLHSLHVIDSPVCVCSHRVEDTAHFFWTLLFIMFKDYRYETLSQGLPTSGLKHCYTAMQILTTKPMLQ